jgi:hypothetical protein
MTEETNHKHKKNKKLIRPTHSSQADKNKQQEE